MSETGQNFIVGAWCDGQSTIANINPSDLSDQIGHYAQANSAQLDSALDAAQTAQKKWAITGLEARQTILMNIGNELMERRIELGTLLSREEGKPLAEGVGQVKCDIRHERRVDGSVRTSNTPTPPTYQLHQILTQL